MKLSNQLTEFWLYWANVPTLIIISIDENKNTHKILGETNLKKKITWTLGIFYVEISTQPMRKTTQDDNKILVVATMLFCLLIADIETKICKLIDALINIETEWNDYR